MIYFDRDIISLYNCIREERNLLLTMEHNKNFRKKILVGALIVFVLLFTLHFIEDATKKETHKKIETPPLPKRAQNVTQKTITGTVSVLIPGFIAVVYDRDKENHTEYEMAFPLTKNVTMANRNSLNEIDVGDTVTIAYDEAIIDSRYGKRLQREAKIITVLDTE